MLRVCIASIQNVERSLLLVVSASDIPLRTIKFFSVLFGVFVHAAGRHKQTFAGASPTVRSREPTKTAHRQNGPNEGRKRPTETKTAPANIQNGPLRNIVQISDK